jgi:hypothetical protein
MITRDVLHETIDCLLPDIASGHSLCELPPVAAQDLPPDCSIFESVVVSHQTIVGPYSRCEHSLVSHCKYVGAQNV